MTHSQNTPPEKILTAARRLFFQQGFEEVSTDLLAKEASVSKTTLYKYFPSMIAVLRAVVEAEVNVFEHGLPPQVLTREDFETTLVRYGENLLHFLNQSDIIQFAQLMFEEARFNPDIATVFYAAAYGRTLQDLSKLIQQGIEKGFLRSALTADELAEQLLGMWEGFCFIRAQLGLTQKPFEYPQEWSQKCVQTLLNGHACLQQPLSPHG
ncbi:TetR/AcrR family transcriptional regulator [Leptolyngbya sp. AN02str]|uniref:TetR/AcrR family transcriptional regulator n=1 Tax=Leptolyngbya sp. AN02str TaxID=3423363 RepID=UPI003D31957C